MSMAKKAAVALYILNVVVWSYLAGGVLYLQLQMGETYYASLLASTRRAREEGLRTEAFTPGVGQIMGSRYGVTNRGVIRNQVRVGTLAEFLEAARITGEIYRQGGLLLTMGRTSLLTYSPVIVGRLWPYTVEWVNQ